MREKRILIVVNFFPPAGGGGVYRPLSFVKYLARLSWKVTVLTPNPGEFWISDPGLEDQIPDGVSVVRTFSLSPSRLLNAIEKRKKHDRSRRSTGGFELFRRLGEFILLPDTYVGWTPFAYRAVSRLCRNKDFDVILSTSPPDSTHLAAGRLSRKYGIPWVVDFRDPWISLYLRNPVTAVHRILHQKMERHAAAADRVLVTTDWQRDKLLKLYPGCSVEKIANGYEEEDFSGLEDLKPDTARFTILHSGMLTL
ncbi:glycosyltransferase, partial [bacterium]|nr:glycosyltransferase [bacterium]